MSLLIHELLSDTSVHVNVSQCCTHRRSGESRGSNVSVMSWQSEVTFLSRWTGKSLEGQLHVEI